MVKILKLKNKYIASDGEFDVFMVEYSDSHLFQKGNFILDKRDTKMTSKYIEKYINTEMHKTIPDEEKYSFVQNFIYKIDDPLNNININSFIINMWREYQIKNIIY